MQFSEDNFESTFQSNDDCLSALYNIKFPKGVKCPFCQRKDAYHKHHAKHCYTCNCGKSQIYPKKGTIYESSPVPLKKWFKAVFLLCASKEGVSAKELERQLEVTYPTAWRMTKKIKPILPQIGARGSDKYFYGAIENSIIDRDEQEKYSR